jgi:hypothetical protein
MAETHTTTPCLDSGRLSRRNLFIGAPVVALGAALAAGDAKAALAGVLLPKAKETPVAAMYGEITRLQAWINGDNGLSNAELAVETDRLHKMANAIMRLPSDGPMDFIHKLMGHTLNGENCPCCCPDNAAIWKQAKAIVGGMA